MLLLLFAPAWLSSATGMGSFSSLVCQILNAVKLQDAAPLFSTSSPRPSLSRFCLLSPLPRRCFRCSASAWPVVVVCEDEKHGKKEVISLTSKLYKYVLSNVREPEILREVREETARMRGSQMQVSPEQAQFLSMLVQILRAKRCIEISIYTGYSSLSIASAVLPSRPHTPRQPALKKQNNGSNVEEGETGGRSGTKTAEVKRWKTEERRLVVSQHSKFGRREKKNFPSQLQKKATQERTEAIASDHNHVSDENYNFTIDISSNYWR